MSNTYTTTVPSMLVAKSMDGYTDVVTVVNWQVVASDGTYNAGQVGSTPVGPVDPNDFTPYADLTQEHVLSWIPDPATPELKAELDANIATQAAAIVTMGPPWS